jgi:hypothetical protein
MPADIGRTAVRSPQPVRHASRHLRASLLIRVHLRFRFLSPPQARPRRRGTSCYSAASLSCLPPQPDTPRPLPPGAALGIAQQNPRRNSYAQSANRLPRRCHASPHPRANPPACQRAPRTVAPHPRNTTARRNACAQRTARSVPPHRPPLPRHASPVTPRLSSTTVRHNALRPENRPVLTSAAARDGHHPPVPGRPRQPGIPAAANPHLPAATPYALTNPRIAPAASLRAPRPPRWTLLPDTPARPRPNPTAPHPQPPRQETAQCDPSGGGWSKPAGWPI